VLVRISDVPKQAILSNPASSLKINFRSSGDLSSESHIWRRHVFFGFFATTAVSWLSKTSITGAGTLDILWLHKKDQFIPLTQLLASMDEKLISDIKLR
jgi:hypothetical protein